ncbi:hypothetical protein ACLOJK_012361 [Asimina triloba]
MYNIFNTPPEHGAPVWCSIIFPNPVHLHLLRSADPTITSSCQRPGNPSTARQRRPMTPNRSTRPPGPALAPAHAPSPPSSTAAIADGCLIIQPWRCLHHLRPATTTSQARRRLQIQRHRRPSALHLLHHQSSASSSPKTHFLPSDGSRRAPSIADPSPSSRRPEHHHDPTSQRRPSFSRSPSQIRWPRTILPSTIDSSKPAPPSAPASRSMADSSARSSHGQSSNPSPSSTSSSLSINRSIAHQIRPTNPSTAGWSAIRSTFIHPPSSSHGPPIPTTTINGKAPNFCHFANN